MDKEAQPRGRGRPPLTEAAKFRELDANWRTKVDHLSADEVNAEIVEITKKEKLNQLAKKEDPKLQKAKEEAKELGAGYRELTKEHKLEIEYALKRLHELGKL